MRRIIVLLAAVLAMCAGASSAAIAQEAPAGPQSADRAIANLGYPELHVTVTDDGLEAPDRIAAGRVVLTVENQRDAATVVAPIQLADGDAIDDVVAAAQTTGTGNDALMPYEDATWAGGEPAMPGESTTGMVITLTPGTWYLLDASDLKTLPPTLTVTGDLPQDTGEVPGTAVSIEMTDFQFAMPDRIEAGTHLWKFTNTGRQLHDIHILRVPDGTTPDEVLSALTRPEDAEVKPGDLVANENMIPMFGFGIMSSDQAIWTDVSIEPGTYVIVTWMNEQESGVPQFALGMLSVFTVVEPGQDASPPPASPEPVEPMA